MYSFFSPMRGAGCRKSKVVCGACTVTVMKKIRSNLKAFHWRLWLSLCALALIPAVYQTVKTFLLSSSGQAGVFDIIGQMEWFDLINETLQAFLIVPLYAVLNRVFQDRRAEFAEAVYKTGLCAVLLYALFSVGVLFCGAKLLAAMEPGAIDMTAAAAYLRLETQGFLAGVAVSFANVVFVVIGRARNVWIFLAVRTALAMAADFLLIPRLGVYGAAASNILVNVLLTVVCMHLLYRQGYIRPCRFRRGDAAMLREWGRIGVFSGLQQFIDNLIYAVMVCKMVNMVAGQGNYWLANNFIWGWLLISVSALAEVIRSDCKDGYRALRQGNYYVIAAASVLLWAVTVPLWVPFFRDVQGLDNAADIFAIVIRLAPFYIAYAGCAIIDSIFVGLGKTGYTAVNSLLLNLGYYGVFYLLYRARAITFTMDTIILMFGFGMVVHYAISLVQERVFLRRRERQAGE